jgi:hypothetical protein
MADVIRRMERKQHKTAQVLWEIRALKAGFVPPAAGERMLLKLEVTPHHLPKVLEAAADALVDERYQYVDMWTRSLEKNGRAKGVPLQEPIAFHERIALVMASELLAVNSVRRRLHLPWLEPKYGPPTDGDMRNNDAPRLRGQLPPPRTRDR